MDEVNFEKLKKKKRKKVIDKLVIILILVLSAVLCFSLYKIVVWYQDNKENQKENQKAIDAAERVEISGGKSFNEPKNKFDPYWDFIKYPLISVDFDNLKKMNSDTVGWIFMRNSNINYPVVQTTDNAFYLNHGYDKKYNDAGWVFMDYRNNPDDFSKNTIIYAHSRIDRSMFGTLRNAVKRSWFEDKENHIIRFSTPKENTLWLVFSTYTINSESYYLTTNFEDNAAYSKWVDEMKIRSKFDYNTEVSSQDKILTLSSCYTADGIRVVVHAKLIKIENRN